MIDFFADLWCYAKKNKKLWMIPLVVIMLLASALLLFTQGAAVSPFIYAWF